MYSIKLSESSEKFLKKIPKKDAEMVLKKIHSIRDNPFRFLKRLQGQKLWRLRITDYSAVVDIIVKANQITVVRIGKRKNIYKK